MTNPDDPIHPKEPKHLMGDLGLTKREWFAGMAMGSLEISAISPNKAASWCIEYADALITELNKKGES